MDRLVSESVKKKRKRKIIIRSITASSVFIILIIALRLLIKPSISSEDFETATAVSGSIQATITASGTVVPEFEEIISSPIDSKIISIVHNTGDKVNPGDTILVLDTKSAYISLDKMKDEQEVKKNNVNKLKLQLERDLIDLKTRQQIKELQVERLETELKEEEYLKDIGGGTKEKVEKAILNLKIATIELREIEETIINQEKSMETDLYGLNYEISIGERNLKELQEKINGSSIIADKKGVITRINSEIGISVGTGEELVKIADLESYCIEGKISETHASKLSSGAQLIVQLDEKTRINGQITSISPSVESNTIHFKVRIDEKNHPLLRPNLKVDLYIITSHKENVLMVLNGAFYRGAVRQNVFVLKDGFLYRREVEFGLSNFDNIEIINGLNEGDEVLISDMYDYERLEKIQVRTKK